MRDHYMRDHYDFSKGVRGKHAKRLRKVTSIVQLDPDIAKEFPDSAAVNEALREYLRSKKPSTDQAT